MPTVKECCCGCSLRTGTMTLLWLGLALVGLNFLYSMGRAASQKPPYHFQYLLIEVLIDAISIAIHTVGIYSVEMEKPAYLIPYLVHQVIGMVLLIIGMIIAAIFKTGILTKILDTSGDNEDAIATVIAKVGIIGAEILFLFELGLVYYSFIVALSFYKELKKKAPRQ